MPAFVTFNMFVTTVGITCGVAGRVIFLLTFRHGAFGRLRGTDPR